MNQQERLLLKPAVKVVMVRANSTYKRVFLAVLLVLIVTALLIISDSDKEWPNQERASGRTGKKEEPVNIFEEYERSDYRNGKWRELSDEEIGNMSVLGRIMFLDEEPPQPKLDKKYKILVWKYGKTTENRHLKHYGKYYVDPFEQCSVKNCEITFKDEEISEADMVIFHMHRMKGVKDLPEGYRDPNQIWTFLIDESPYHIFLNGNLNKIKDYNNVFNWSMTYRFGSDIPVPYGRTVPLAAPDDSLVDSVMAWKRSKRKKIAILGSNCGSKNHRWEYVKKLQEYIDVDVYGGCGKLKCPGHFNKDCQVLEDYMFYLAFENSNCEEYITEKLWWNAYSKNAIPIIMGDRESTLVKLLPPHSYLYVDNFATPMGLAEYIKYLVESDTELQPYFQWKKYFKVLQEHGYFQSRSFHYCRACEALNYNSRETKVYTQLENLWGQGTCYPKWDDRSD